MEVTEAMVYAGCVKNASSMLHISDKTVQQHLKNIYSKLGIHSAGELVRWWMCQHYGLHMEVPAKWAKRIALVCLLLMIPELYDFSSVISRSRARGGEREITEISVRTRKIEN